MDLSLFKTFTIHERLKAQFRAEALNTLNTPNFGRVTTQRKCQRRRRRV